jgi:molybdate transport system ATP-binding protein
MISLQICKPLIGSGGEMRLEVALEIEKGAFVALAGPSGSGKTTLLRILAGLEEAQGRIEVEGETWLEGKRSLAPRHRGIGFVFQDYALFENMSVEENLLFVRKDLELAEELLEMTGLTELRRRLPGTLSGGQKQRVALCRALMNRPKLLLMDEPLSALDPQMRAKLQDDILTLHKAFGTTTLMVSHDPSEIYRLAGRVVVLEHGGIIRDASPKEALLQTQGSQKFSLVGELLEIVRVDVIHVAVVAIGQQLVEVVLDSEDVGRFTVGERVRVSTKAFAPSLGKL